MDFIIGILMLLLNIYLWLIIFTVIVSWLVAFDVLNTRNRWVYKLCEILNRLTNPVVQRVRRYYDGFGGPVCDMIYDEDHLAGEGAARGNTLVAVNDAALVTDVSELEYRELLVPIVRDGSAVAPRESIQDARERCVWALDHLDAAFKRFLYPQTYVVGMEQGLAQVRDELVRKNMAAASAFPWAK